MADDRRIIFGTHVVPKEAADAEESIPQKWTIMRQDTSGDVVATTLGGKSTCTDLANSQWSDSWTSMAHQQMNWEDWDDTTDISGNRWEDVEEYWNGTAEVGTGAGIALSDDTGDVSFCYIKNTGTTNDLSVAVDGDNDYFILVPPGGSVQFRGGDAAFNCDQVYMKAVGGSTTAEYIIAKK